MQGQSWRGVIAATVLIATAGCAGPIQRISCDGFADRYLTKLPENEIVQDIHGDVDRVIINQALIDQLQSSKSGASLLNLMSSGANPKLQQIPETATEPRPDAVLMLSGGGQWGAYGAAFLQQLARQDGNTPKLLPKFGFVTGISTGAMQALFVGQSNDPATRQAALDQLVDRYTIQKETDIVHRRGLLGVVFKGSMANLDPLRRRIEDALCPPGASAANPCPAIARLADKRAPLVLVGMVEARSGDLMVANITRIAQDAVKAAASQEEAARRYHNAQQCITGAVLSSAAIPLYYQQVQVGSSAPKGQVSVDGRTYFDGGVRSSVLSVAFERLTSSSFARQLILGADAMRADDKMNMAPGAAEDGGPIFVVRNGPTVASQAPDNIDQPLNALDALQRAYALIVNQSEVMSIAALRLVPGKRAIHFTSADGYNIDNWQSSLPPEGFGERNHGPCAKIDQKAMFEPQFMGCLRSFGRLKATTLLNGTPWRPIRSVAEVTASYQSR